MFENLTGRLSSVISKLRGQARLTEEDISATMREVRMALLEADVALPVVKDFIDHVRARIDGQELNSSLTPGQYIIKIVHAELIALMGMGGALNLHVPTPAVILMAGLQGAGKTTTVAKLACWLRKRHGKKVMAVSCDVYRPAAIEQLAVLGRQHDFEIFPSDPAQAPIAIAEAAMQKARARFMDVLLVDTAGRLHVDQEMMGEIVQIHAAIKPSDTLFIVDSMLGQDAVNSASAFNQALPLSGIILTKADGDARGGAALSVRHVTGKPILFMGTGEKIEELSTFHADRVASRILGMGDVLSLIEEVEQKTDRDKAEKLAKKLTKGGNFSLADFREQLDQMRKMGGIASLMDKLPGLPKLPEGAMQQTSEKELIRLAAIIDSMTPGERRFPATINGSRKKRIANGSGMQIQDVNRLLKQFDQMQKMMKRLNKKGGMKNLMRGLSANLPRGFRR